MSIIFEGRQLEAIKGAEKWFREGNKQVYTIAGYAGTGKSTIVNAIVNNLGITNNTTFATFTGKASLVLNRKGNPAQTLHRLMYVIEEDLSYAGYTELVFRKRDFIDPSIKLIVVDEISMVDSELMRDLLSFGVPIIALGDPGQLPPVKGDSNGYLDNPDVFLEEIHRQAAGNPIIYLSMLARQGKKIELGKYGKNVLVVSPDQITDSAMKRLGTKGQIICGYNRSRTAINSRVRQMLGFESDLPEIGDKVICTRNNWMVAVEGTPLINGTIGEVTGVGGINRRENKLLLSFKPDFANTSYIDLECDTQEFLNVPKDKVIRNDYNKFDYGYAITCHKCISEDTWIYTDKGLMQLKELNNGAEEGEFREITEDIKVYNGEYLERPKAFYNNGVSKNRKIETNNGYKLEASMEHGVTTIGEDGYVKKVAVRGLKEGDYVLVRRNQNIYGNNIEIPKEWFDINIHARAYDYKLPEKLDEDFAKFLGLMVSDGCIANSRIFLFKRHREVVEEFKRVVDKLFGIDGYDITEKTGGYEYSINSTKIVEFCRKIDGIQPNNKFVPSIIMRAPKNIQKEFLQGVFTDGTVQLRNGKFDHIYLSLSGNKAIEQIKMMLLNMGIVTGKVRDKITNAENLTIYKEFAKIYLNEIGFIEKEKSERLKMCLGEIKQESPRKSYKYITNIVKELIKKYDYKDINYSVKSSLQRNKITERTLRIFLDETKEIMGKDKEYVYLKDLVENYYIDRVHSIVDSENNTYCLEMHETHQFIQNGIHAWNSQGSEFDDVLLFEEILNPEMHSRWFYTGITRAAKTLVIASQQRRYW